MAGAATPSVAAAARRTSLLNDRCPRPGVPNERCVRRPTSSEHRHSSPRRCWARLGDRLVAWGSAEGRTGGVAGDQALSSRHRRLRIATCSWSGLGRRERGAALAHGRRTRAAGRPTTRFGRRHRPATAGRSVLAGPGAALRHARARGRSVGRSTRRSQLLQIEPAPHRAHPKDVALGPAVGLGEQMDIAQQMAYEVVRLGPQHGHDVEVGVPQVLAPRAAQ